MAQHPHRSHGGSSQSSPSGWSSSTSRSSWRTSRPPSSLRIPRLRLLRARWTSGCARGLGADEGGLGDERRRAGRRARRHAPHRRGLRADGRRPRSGSAKTVIDALADELRTIGFSDAAVSFWRPSSSGSRRGSPGALEGIVSRLGDLTTVLILGGFLTTSSSRTATALGDLADSLAGSYFDELTSRAWLVLERVGRYLRATFVAAAIDAVVAFVVLVVLGVPFAGALAVLVFMGGFIPYLGRLLHGLGDRATTWATQGIGAPSCSSGLVVTKLAQPRSFPPPVWHAPGSPRRSCSVAARGGEPVRDPGPVSPPCRS